MINLKSDQEIEIMKQGGKILKSVVDELIPKIALKKSTKYIEDEARILIGKNNAKPSFTTVKGYSWCTCLPVNEQAVHTPPSKRTLKNGDLLTLDIGLIYKGFHTDYATTIAIGDNISDEKKHFLEVGKKTLDSAIKLFKTGVYLGSISEFIENEINASSYFILKDLTGHGIGRELHEDPYVFNYLDRPVNKTYKIKAGLVVAVEIIYSMGTEEIAYEKGVPWSIVTSDRSLSACFEKTIAVAEGNTFILT